MTDNVFGGTLNLALSIYGRCREFAEHRQLYTAAAGNVKRERWRHRRLWQTSAGTYCPFLNHWYATRLFSATSDFPDFFIALSVDGLLSLPPPRILLVC